MDSRNLWEKSFLGTVILIENGIARFELVDEDGRRSIAECDASQFKGIQKGDDFKYVIQENGSVISRVRRERMSADDVTAIRKEIEADLEGLE